MKKKGIEDVKNSKYFSVWDIIPYAIVLVVAAVLMLVFLLPEKEKMNGFYVEYGENVILTYGFSSDEFTVTDGFENNVEVKEENGGYTVEINTGDGFNAFFVDKEKRTVKMIDSDCSFTRDCTYMPAIEESGDSIICVPHKLKIIADGSGLSSPVTR